MKYNKWTKIQRWMVPDFYQMCVSTNGLNNASHNIHLKWEKWKGNCVCAVYPPGSLMKNFLPVVPVFSCVRPTAQQRIQMLTFSLQRCPFSKRLHPICSAGELVFHLPFWISWTQDLHSDAPFLTSPKHLSLQWKHQICVFAGGLIPLFPPLQHLNYLLTPHLLRRLIKDTFHLLHLPLCG